MHADNRKLTRNLTSLEERAVAASRWRLARDPAGIASLEFALVAPVLLMLVIGGFDISRAMLLWQQVWLAAHDISLSAATIAVQTDKTSTLTPAQAQQAMSIVYAAMPTVRNGAASGVRSVTLTSVDFVPVANCTPVTGNTNCYVASVVWSVTYGGGGQAGWTPLTRSCGPLPLVQIQPTANPPAGVSQLGVLTTLNVSSPDPSIVADVHYQFTPMPFDLFMKKQDFWATAIFSTRTGATASVTTQYATYTGTDGTGTCPGFQSGYF